MEEKIKKLEESFKKQMEATEAQEKQLNGQLNQLTIVKEQLRGAIFALTELQKEEKVEEKLEDPQLTKAEVKHG